MLAEHREGIQEFRSVMDRPPAPVTNEGRLMMAKQLANDVLAILPEQPETVPDAELYRWVNISYDAMVTVIDLYKTSLDAPTVPRAR